MKYDRFEELPVWKAAVDVFVLAEKLVRHKGFANLGDMRDQLLRAALSVSNNIAEGFELGTTQQLITFLYTARGSAGEVRSMMCVCEGLERFADLKSQISDLKLKAENVSRQLRGWAESLQNSEIKGTRYLTEASKAEFDQRKRAEAFWEHVKKVAPPRKPSGQVIDAGEAQSRLPME